MDWVFPHIKEQIFLSPLQPPPPPYLHSQPPPPPPPPLPPANHQSGGLNLNTVSPNVLLIIIILAIIFFISGLLHLLVRLLARASNREPGNFDDVTALQGQLQQLFNLHDAGVDQSFIDTLPVFNYKAIVGANKSPFDCAVCLCEFDHEDELRLLPKCSHAFHMDCIDTWLLSHSTCPICRASLLQDFSPNHHSRPPIVLVLESGSESSREIVSDGYDGVVGSTTNSLARANSHLGIHGRDEFASSRVDFSCKSGEIREKDFANRQSMVGSDEKVVAVKLGKFRNVEGGGGGGGGGEGGSSSSNNSVVERRCFSMGYFAYVEDENLSLRVSVRIPLKKQSNKRRPSLPLRPGHRPAMSECGCNCDSRREFNGFEPFTSVDIHGVGDAIGRRNKKESFSVSKIWLRAKKEKPNPTAGELSRRAFSFRFPVHRNVLSGEELKPKSGGGGSGRNISDIDFGSWENGGSELGCDEENQSCNSLDSHANLVPSFGRRTLLWLAGRQNKVVHSSSTPDV